MDGASITAGIQILSAGIQLYKSIKDMMRDLQNDLEKQQQKMRGVYIVHVFTSVIILVICERILFRHLNDCQQEKC
jgi:hypothetical protein